MIIIDKQTRRRVVTDPHAGDIIYPLNHASTSIINEDLQFGDTDNPSSPTREKQMHAGTENKFFGTDAGLTGAKLDNLTSRGNPKSTRFTKQRERKVELSTSQ